MNQQQDQGSVGLGFVLGFFLGCIGIAVAYFAIKKPDTTKGAVYGIVAQVVLGIIMGVAVPMMSR